MPPRTTLFLAALLSALPATAYAQGAMPAAGEALFPDARMPDSAPPVAIWSGPYAGTFVGYNVSRYDDLRGASVSGEGVSGGAYGGFNLQSGALVYGIEGDIGGSGYDAIGRNAVGNRDVSGESNVFGSLRGRVGVDVDPFLIYGTGGLAVARSELSLGSASDSRTSVGYTLGAGVEAKITDTIDTRLEYRYSDYGSQTYDLGNTSVSSGFDEHSVRAGVSLKF
ncbi:outer membrane protein [Fulvimarina sp. 2208YS6-2-32]|uniref:Outer membrane protein n=1 Tax=Fulvimarina uroteuthidis TaxID=3098149 RepID=A0ABU5I7T9_9HYPH|nr:outer membrane protein [Fulvimarina sp. 2208YS6-2-32]MDY8110286.1 outer membrane protein [Fulvimarina sp. 2208YS6-2-32]